jgi:hypothetical protein
LIVVVVVVIAVVVIVVVVKVLLTKDLPGTRWMRRVNNVPHVGNGWGGQRGGGGS